MTKKNNRQILAPIDQPDITRTDQEYWEEVLRSQRLTVNRGKYMSHREADALADTIRTIWLAEERKEEGKI